MLAYVARRAVWLIVYLLFVLAPLLALLMGDHPPARDFWTEFSSAIAYAGLAMMGLQFGLTAASATSPNRGARTLFTTSIVCFRWSR